jgi:hypothetical protein
MPLPGAASLPMPPACCATRWPKIRTISKAGWRWAMALVGHADGFVTPAAVQAFGRAKAIDPAHPGAEYFLGFAYLQSGEIRAARNVWAGLVAARRPMRPGVKGLRPSGSPGWTT